MLCTPQYKKGVKLSECPKEGNKDGEWSREGMSGKLPKSLFFVFFLEKRSLRGDLIAAYSFLEKGSGGAGIIYTIDLQGNGMELFQRRFRLDFREWLGTGTGSLGSTKLVGAQEASG